MSYAWSAIIAMAAVSFVIRCLPLTLFRKRIRSPFIRSFLYYLPYVTLAVMTFPAILRAPGSWEAGSAALAAAVIAALRGAGLIKVAAAAALAVLAAQWLSIIL